MTAVRDNRFHKYIEDNLKSYLRTRFSSNVSYPYSSFIRQSKIWINTFFPQTISNKEIPAIVIHHPHLDVSRRTIGTDYLDSDFSTIFIPGCTIGLTVYPGSTVVIPSVEYKGYDVPGTVEIETIAIDEDDADLVQEVIAEYLTDYTNLRNAGLIISSVDIGHRTEVRVGNDLYFSGSVDCGILGTWQSTDAVNVVDVIAKITAETPVFYGDGATSF